MKQPKFANAPAVDKTVKTIPDNHLIKDNYVSWQINRIDLEGTWGLNALELVDFIIENGAFDELVNIGISEELLGALDEMNRKEFGSVSEFLIKLCSSSSFSVNSEHLKLIFQSLTKSIFWREIHPKLKDFETKTWFEIDKELFGKNGKTKHHHVSVSKVIQDAKKRLKELNLDHYDELYSMRLTGKIRLWGIREQGYLKILWFDLNHQICPSLRN